jgi:DNA-binding response OmpR family regulator
LRILIIEDDATIAANLYDYFEAHGHSIDAAGDGVTGLHLAVSQTFDVIVLDLGLPGMDGLSLARKLREEAHLDTPILMLTARDTLDDKLEGFSRGADDYLVKPFSLKEVEARLIAMHRRSSGRVTPRILECGQLTLDPKTMAVTFVIGNAHKISPSLFAPGTTISATIANEFTEAVGDIYTSALIELGLILFFITFVVLSIARYLLMRIEQKSA